IRRRSGVCNRPRARLRWKFERNAYRPSRRFVYALRHGTKLTEIADGRKRFGGITVSEEMKEMKETMTPDAGAQDGGSVVTGGQDTAGKDAPKGDVKTITQEELDRIIQQRLQRERKKWEQQIEEERRKAAMTEAERLKAEKEEAERKAQE